MDNLLLKNEANRIYKIIINKNEYKESLDLLFHSILNKNYEKYDMKVLVYLTDILAQNNYSIESIDPFRIEKK